MKKLIFNLLWTVPVTILGIVIFGLYLTKWVPSSEPVLLGLWAYTGWLVGFVIMAIGLFNNFFVKAAINAFVDTL